MNPHARKGREQTQTHIKLDLRDLGSLVSFLGEGVANLDRLGLLGELFKEFVIYLGLNEDATTGAAALAMVPATQRVSDQHQRTGDGDGD